MIRGLSASGSGLFWIRVSRVQTKDKILIGWLKSYQHSSRLLSEDTHNESSGCSGFA
jgi:hypothetical protein